MMRKNIIGLSLSSCIEDICCGVISEHDVEKIVSRNALPNAQAAIDAYGFRHWAEFRNRATTTVIELWSNGKIEQPRLDGAGGHSVSKDGNWLDVERGKQFTIIDGERVESDNLGKGVDLILSQARKDAAKEKISGLGIKQNTNGRTPD